MQTQQSQQKWEVLMRKSCEFIDTDTETSEFAVLWCKNLSFQKCRGTTILHILSGQALLLLLLLKGSGASESATGYAMLD